jgi:ABC-2 type transport system permease protein
MTPYLAVLGARFRLLLQYRVAALAGLWTQIFFGLVLVMVYEAFYRSAGAPPLAFAQLASYVWLGQALFATLPWNVDPELRAMVRSGAVAYELCRPVDLYGLWLARAVAQRTAPAVLRALPLAVFAAVVLPALGLGAWRLTAPASLAAGLGFAASLACALVLGSAMSALINVLLLWTLAADGLTILLASAVSLGCGLAVPLPLLPDGVQAVLRWLPFAGVFDLPLRIYTGALPAADLASVLARQLGWAAALALFGRGLLARGVRRIVVHGG